MKKVLLILSMFLFIGFTAEAQSYKTAIGVRAGNSTGVTLKHFTGTHGAFEGILSSRWRGWNFTGLYEVHNNIDGNSNFHWYYGAGGHVGVWDGDNNPWFEDNDNHTVIGIDGIIGMEYSFYDIPLNLSIDWKPSYNVHEHTGFWGDEFALSARLILNR